MASGYGQVVIAGMPVMVGAGFRLGIAYLKFKLKAKRAAALFERELQDGGMDRELARELTDMYLGSSRMVRMAMRGAMARGRPAWRGRAAAARK